MDTTVITEALTTAVSVAGKGVTFIAENALCMVFCAMSLLRAGIHLFGSAKNASM